MPEYRVSKDTPCHTGCGRPAAFMTGAGHICEECHGEGRTEPVGAPDRCRDCAHACGVMFSRKHYFCQVVKNRQGAPKKIRLKDGACKKFVQRTAEIPTVHAAK